MAPNSLMKYRGDGPVKLLVTSSIGHERHFVLCLSCLSSYVVSLMSVVLWSANSSWGVLQRLLMRCVTSSCRPVAWGLSLRLVAIVRVYTQVRLVNYIT